MIYEVWLWLTAHADDPDVRATQEADDPLEATFAVMRARTIPFAFCAQAFLNGQWVAGYSEFSLPDREVC
jgi:hypothetical protein